MKQRKMQNRTLKKRLLQLQNRSDACVLAFDLGDTRENCEGTPAERFIAGWVNAMDMFDDDHPETRTDEGFLRFCLYEVRNIGFIP